MSRARIGFVIGAILGFGPILMGSCSLGLDESLITKNRDGGESAVDGMLSDGAPSDGSDGGPPATPEAVACTSDDVCKTTDPCLVGKCDLARKTCVYEVCRSTCTAAACDAQKHACNPGAAYKYKATQFSLGQQILCGRCAVAIHPWLFVATPTGVVAFNVSNPANGSPPQVPIVGLGFVPTQLVQSGSRAWMIGAASGGGPSRIPVAYIDPPADPFASKIVAKTVLLSYNRPAAEGVTLFPRGGDSALLVGPQTAQHASAFLEAPLADPVTATATALLFTPNTSPATVSGKRLLMEGVTGGTASFNLIDNAGGPNPQNGAGTSIGDLANNVSGSQSFGLCPDGAVFWGVGAHQGAGMTATTRAVRGYFLVPGDTGAIEANAGVDIELYNGDPANPVPANSTVVGPIAMLDAKTAMIATAARDNPPLQTAVQFVRRAPLGPVAARRQVLPVPITQFAAAAASDGIGYLVANDTEGPPATGTVYVFDPACAP
jgi:hypothetical protein